MSVSQEYQLHDRVALVTGGTRVAEDCRRVVREVIAEHGRIDILVNNAGMTIDRTVAKMTGEDWQRVISINLSGAFFVAQAALAHDDSAYITGQVWSVNGGLDM